jgi:hypothetical protein
MNYIKEWCFYMTQEIKEWYEIAVLDWGGANQPPMGAGPDDMPPRPPRIREC